MSIEGEGLSKFPDSQILYNLYKISKLMHPGELLWNSKICVSNSTIYNVLQGHQRFAGFLKRVFFSCAAVCKVSTETVLHSSSAVAKPLVYYSKFLIILSAMSR